MNTDESQPPELKKSLHEYIRQKIEAKFKSIYGAYRHAKNSGKIFENFQTILNFMDDRRVHDNIVPGKISTLCSMVRMLIDKSPTELTDEDIVLELFVYYISLSEKEKSSYDQEHT